MISCYSRNISITPTLWVSCPSWTLQLSVIMFYVHLILKALKWWNDNTTHKTSETRKQCTQMSIKLCLYLDNRMKKHTCTQAQWHSIHNNSHTYVDCTAWKYSWLLKVSYFNSCLWTDINHLCSDMTNPSMKLTFLTISFPATCSYHGSKLNPIPFCFGSYTKLKAFETNPWIA